MASVYFNDREIRNNISELKPKLRRAIEAAVGISATEGQSRLKIDAPWSDETGAARAGLHTIENNQGDRFSIIFAHAVHYGIWLEVRWSGKYEVIMPTVVSEGRALMGRVDGIMGRLR